MFSMAFWHDLFYMEKWDSVEVEVEVGAIGQGQAKVTVQPNSVFITVTG